MSENKAIVLNRMYVGEYLSANLGHEVINLFQADNGNHYIYLNSTGNLASVHSGRISYMLFVKYYDKGVVEIIGMATGLKEVPGVNMPLKRKMKFNGLDKDIWQQQVNYINSQSNSGVSYSGVSILELFNDAEQQNIFITYRAEKVYRINRKIHRYICFSNAENDILESIPEDEIIQLEEIMQAKASLKQYIYPSNRDDHVKLLSLFADSSLWENNVVGKVNIEELYSVNKRKVSLFDICRIHSDENRFSNALTYFMEQGEYFHLWKDFFYKYGIALKRKFAVLREHSAKIEDETWNHESNPGGGRIDLLICDNENLIVIENKIMSGINTVATDINDRTQLNRYVNYIDWLVKNNCEQKLNSYFFILTPSYNKPAISKEMASKYKVITYADLYRFLKEHIYVFYNDDNFIAFFEAMERHTYNNINDYLYYEMQEKFYRRIAEYKR